jgi:iron only hydrogenase large subunit-like protein/serine phosphatase RsbU (regulator of sigma subunit)
MNVAMPEPLHDPSKRKLQFVIDVDKDKCVNCHKCISVCPTKFGNDGSGDFVTVNPDLCIGCGECLKACTHEARFFIDDMPEFIDAIRDNEKIIAIVAPSIAANFPDQYLNLNGWMKELGIDAIFDVSFGAELTVKSYLEYIKKNDPQVVIAQPCPAIVTYIETYRPELIPYLAPVDSPMLHAIKMIREYYTEYKDHKIAILSPCLAKKREFNETGLGDFNIGFVSLKRILDANHIDLEDFPKVDFDNPPAERAVLFSSPGGLLRTAQRWVPDIAERTRKIEGVHSIYDYLDKLHKLISESRTPLIVDCLNCEKGCNGGTLTINKEESIEDLEYFVENRNKEMKKLYAEDMHQETDTSAIEKIIDKYWRPGLYERKYVNRHKNNILKHPNDAEMQKILQSMHKYTDEDQYNCAACGYEMCERMALAIFNGLNKPENCHFYLAKESEIANEKLQDLNANLEKKVVERTLELRDKNRQIMDSIKYSERIQKAILPSQARLDDVLNHHFILYQPKDILSGDIFWVNRIEDSAIVAAIDCTGHGVPGSMLSMVGFMVLNDIVLNRKMYDPAEILTELDDMVKVILRQKMDTQHIGDGMDVCLCKIDKGGEHITYAGARRPLYVVREGILQEIKGAKRSIGGSHKEEEREFVNMSVDLAHGNMIYLTTDGIMDQFDKHGKRFGSRKLKEMIKDVSEHDVKMQKIHLQRAINEHLEYEEQIDDITIMGVKMSPDTVA